MMALMMVIEAEVRVDHPFFYAIIDGNKTLFNGRLVDPSAL